MSGKIMPEAQRGDIQTMPTEQIIQHYLAMNPRSTADAFQASLSDRRTSDQGKTGQNRNLNLRDAEHYLLARDFIERAGAPNAVSDAATRAGILGMAPAYAALKALLVTPTT